MKLTRRRGLRTLATVFLAVVMTLGLSVAPAYAADTEGPVLRSAVRTSADVVAVGDDVTIDFVATDPSGLDQALFGFYDSAGHAHYASAYHVVSGKKTTATTQVDASWADGPITVTTIWLYDVYGNARVYDDAYPDNKFNREPLYFTVGSEASPTPTPSTSDAPAPAPVTPMPEPTIPDVPDSTTAPAPSPTVPVPPTPSASTSPEPATTTAPTTEPAPSPSSTLEPATTTTATPLPTATTPPTAPEPSAEPQQTETPSPIAAPTPSTPLATSPDPTAPGGAAPGALAAAPMASTSVQTLSAGDTVTLHSEGWVAHETLEVWFHSEPTLLLRGTTDAYGVLNASVTVPASAPAGAHTLVIQNGTGRSVSMSLTIESSPTTAPTVTGDESLVSTGGTTGPMLIAISIAVVVLGTCMIVLRRWARIRRR